MRWSPGCGGCGPGCSPESSMKLNRSPCSAAFLQSPAALPSSSTVAAASRSCQPHLPQTEGTQIPATGTAPTCYALLPLSGRNLWGGFRELQGFRLAELLDWLGSVPPLTSCRSLDGSCVTGAPKKNLEGDWISAGGARWLPVNLRSVGGETEVPQPLR